MLELDPRLSPDLEWMLLGSQTSSEILLEVLVSEHGASLYRLAYALLGDGALALQAVSESLLAAVAQRGKYHEGTNVSAWLFSLEIELCRKISQDARNFDPGASFPISLVQTLERGPISPATQDRTLLFLAYDDLPSQARLTAILIFIFELGELETATALGASRAEVASWLKMATGRFKEEFPRLVVSHGIDHAWIRNYFQHHWDAEPAASLDSAKLESMLQSRLAKKRWLSQRISRFQQAALGLVILVFIALVGRFTQTLSSNAELHPGPVTKVVVTRLVPVQVHVTATPVPTPTISPTPPVLESLLFNADEERIRLRIGQSRSIVGQVWVDAQLVEYGPAGYIGSPRTYRTQMWLQDWSPENPTERRLVLAGSTIRPETALYIQDDQMFEVDFLTGLSYQFAQNFLSGAVLNEYDPRLTVAPNVRYPGRRSLQDGTFLSGLLFGSWFSTEGGSLEIAFTDQMFDRDILVIKRMVEGETRERAWIDALTGIALRWESYADPNRGIVGAEMYVLDLEFGARFPEKVVSSTFFWKQPVNWDSLRRNAVSSGFSTSRTGLNPRERLDSDDAPPPGFHPETSKLEFQWAPISRPAAQPGDEAEIFADGYFLGRAPMGNPWNLFCERSPDGRLIAFQEAAPNEEGLLFAPSGPMWLDLSEPGVIHNALPNTEIASSDFAFSPDSRYLAFWGCGGGPDNCGIYVHDTQNLKNLKLSSISDGASFFQWSPDGAYLALIGAGTPLKYSTSLLILSLQNGQRVYESETFLPYLPVPGDSPTRQWGVPFPPMRTSLEGCTG